MKTYTPKARPGLRKTKSSESWQTIYMDLMTIIMVFFVILWSLNRGKDIGVSETVGDTSSRNISLPGDVLFAPGKVNITKEGSEIFKKIFYDKSGSVLNFHTSGLVKRLLFIHGHTDSDGDKLKNFKLGHQRAFNAYEELLKYSKDIPDHVVICTHADNSPEQDVPTFEGKLSPAQKAVLREAKSKNRRISIEDRLINRFEAE